MKLIPDLPGADQTVIEYAAAKTEGRRRAKEVMLEALVESDIPVEARRRVLAKMAELGF